MRTVVSFLLLSLLLVSLFSTVFGLWTGGDDPIDMGSLTCGDGAGCMTAFGQRCVSVLGKEMCLPDGTFFTSCEEDDDCDSPDSDISITLKCIGTSHKQCLPGTGSTFCVSSTTCGSGKVCSTFANDNLDGTVVGGVCVTVNGPFAPCDSSDECTVIPEDMDEETTISCTNDGETAGFCRLQFPDMFWITGGEDNEAGGGGDACGDNSLGCFTSTECVSMLGKEVCLPHGTFFTECDYDSDCDDPDSDSTMTLKCLGTNQKQCLPGTGSTFCTSSTTCGDGKVCSTFANENLDETVVGGVCVMANGPFAPCDSSADCTSIPEDMMEGTTMSCSTLGFCRLEFPAIDFGGGIGGGAGSGDSCETNIDCPSMEQCFIGFCIAFEMPSLDCMKEGQSTCEEGEDCFFGICIEHREMEECDPPCGLGSHCNQYAQLCVSDDYTDLSEELCSTCPGGTCIPPSFLGQEPVCTSGDTCTENDDCSNGENCVQSQCVFCGKFCAGSTFGDFGNLFEGLLTLLVSAGNFNASNIFISPPEDSAERISESGTLDALTSGFMILDETLAEMTTLRFPPPGSNSGGNGGESSSSSYSGMNQDAQLAPGSSMTIPQIEAEAGSTMGRLMLGADAELVGNMIVEALAGFTMALSPSGSGGSQTRAYFESLDLQGPLNIVGDPSTIFEFPESAGDNTHSGQGQVRLSGGLNLFGDAGSLPLLIEGDASTYENQFHIPTGETFRSTGSILGDSARIIIRGIFELGSRIIEPTLELSPGARVSITASASESTIAGDIVFDDSDDEGIANIVIEGSATGFGSNVIFAKIASCPENAKITFQLAAGLTITSALSQGFTIMKYSVESSPATFVCEIEICDSSDVCETVENPNIEASTRRRLLTSSNSGGAAANFEPTQLTVGYRSGDSASPNYAMMGIVSLVVLIMGAWVGVNM